MDEYSKKQDNDSVEPFNDKENESVDTVDDVEPGTVKEDSVPPHRETERPYERTVLHEDIRAKIGNDNTPPATPHTSGGLIILQWLTYVFWGWTLLALVWLMFIVFGSSIMDSDVSSVIPYAIASTLVLLPISFICDWFYGKREPQKKTGAAMVVMVIHAVIFALFGIGSLISAVLILVQMMITTPTDASMQMVLLWTFAVSALLYAVTFARTLNPLPKLKLHRIYPLGMAVFVVVLIILGFVGPVAQATLTKDDRDIETHLPTIVYEINNYVDSKGKLPNSLSELSLDGGEKTIVDRGLVTYEREDSSSVSKINRYSSEDDSEEEYRDTFHRYQLCVTYKAEKKGSSSFNGRNLETEYSSSLYLPSHSAGRVCYKIEATSTQSYSDSSDLFKSAEL